MAASKNTETTAVETEKVTRARLSPAEKAVKDLAKAQKRYDAAVAKLDKVKNSIDAAGVEVAEAERFLTFAQGSRHLPAQAQDEVGTHEVQDEELFQANA